MDKKSFKRAALGFLLLFSFIVATLTFHSCGNNPADAIFEATGQSAVVFVKEPSQGDENRTPMASNADEFGSSYRGADIYLLAPASSRGHLTNLTGQYTRGQKSDSSDWGAAEDPEVSYDGKKLLFSMRKPGARSWRICEMNLDGSGLVELTTVDTSNVHDMDPNYLPDGRIVFTSTRNLVRDEYERRLVPQLHVGERGPNGKLIDIRCISMNQSHDNNPIIHSSGKIYYSRWEHLGDPNKFPLFSINPDGTGAFVLYGNHSPNVSGSRVFLELRELEDGGIVSSVMERNSPFEGGAIAIINLISSDNSLSFITPSTVPFNNTNQITTALYKTPYPVMDNGEERLFVAKSPHTYNATVDTGRVDYGIWVMDIDGQHETQIYNDIFYNEIDPVPVHVASRPPVIAPDPGVAAALADTMAPKRGKFFDGNVYHRGGSNIDGQFVPLASYQNLDGSQGQAKYVRVLEGILQKVGMSNDIGMTNFEKQRVVGYADVRSDGSFSIDVPANKPLHVQTLDENGMALVNQLSWIQVMPGERRLCTGCHDSHNRDNIINDLVKQPNGEVYNQAQLSTYQSGFNNAQTVETYDYQGNALARNDTINFYTSTGKISIQGIFNQQCNACHSDALASSNGGGLALEETGKTTVMDDYGNTVDVEYSWVYENLFGRSYTTDSGSRRSAVSDYGARRSPLMWVMYNKQLDTRFNSAGTFRDSLDYDHTQLWAKDSHGRVNPFLPANKDLQVLIEWLDMGAQYRNTNDGSGY